MPEIINLFVQEINVLANMFHLFLLHFQIISIFLALLKNGNR